MRSRVKWRLYSKVMNHTWANRTTQCHKIDVIATFSLHPAGSISLPLFSLRRYWWRNSDKVHLYHKGLYVLVTIICHNAFRVQYYLRGCICVTGYARALPWLFGTFTNAGYIQPFSLHCWYFETYFIISLHYLPNCKNV